MAEKGTRIWATTEVTPIARDEIINIKIEGANAAEINDKEATNKTITIKLLRSRISPKGTKKTKPVA